MSELEADLCVPQMAHLASYQEGTLGKIALGAVTCQLTITGLEDCLDYCQASVPIIVQAEYPDSSRHFRHQTKPGNQIAPKYNQLARK